MKMEGFQLKKPESGDTVAIMHTTLGDIKIKLFKEKTPQTFENFVTKIFCNNVFPVHLFNVYKCFHVTVPRFFLLFNFLYIV